MKFHVTHAYDIYNENLFYELKKYNSSWRYKMSEYNKFMNGGEAYIQCMSMKTHLLVR